MSQTQCSMVFKQLPRMTKLTTHQVRSKIKELLGEKPPEYTCISKNLKTMHKKWNELERESNGNGEYLYWRS